MIAFTLLLSLLIQETSPVAPAAQKVSAPRELIEAAERGQIAKIRGFSSHAAFTERDDRGRTALVAAGEWGQKAAFAELMAIMDERVRKQVALIVVQGQPAVAGGMSVVSARSAFFNAADVRGRTPLMYAAGRGWRDTVDALLEGGADPSARDADGRTAVEHAEDAGYPAIAEALRVPPR